MVEPDNSEYICLPENEKMDEITLSNEEHGFTLDPIDVSGQSHSCFCFLFLIHYSLIYCEVIYEVL